jgi:uncharacterized protein YprB with RNaseH-like and TPR domain
MSALAERLSRLRSQAGIAQSPVGASAFNGGAGKAAKLLPAGSASNPLPGPEASRLPPLPQQAPEPRTVGAVPESIRRLLGIRTRALAAVPARAADRELPGDELAPGLRYRELRFDWGAVPASLDASFAKDFAHIERRDVLAFDTETTGLAGGTGTRAFMIGVADWVDSQEGIATGVAPTNGGVAPTKSLVASTNSRLRVRQLFLTQMRGEAAMLEAFAGWLAPSTVLVSYNGRCYDAPLLDTRYRLARQRTPLAGLRHLDLLFPTRRRYKGRWENCRLATIERHLLGVVREDDLPGSEAPRAWLDWLRGGDAGDFRRVLAHNDQDVRSLVRLLVRLGEVETA